MTGGLPYGKPKEFSGPSASTTEVEIIIKRQPRSTKAAAKTVSLLPGEQDNRAEITLSSLPDPPLSLDGIRSARKTLRQPRRTSTHLCNPEEWAKRYPIDLQMQTWWRLVGLWPHCPPRRHPHLGQMLEDRSTNQGVPRMTWTNGTTFCPLHAQPIRLSSPRFRQSLQHLSQGGYQT